LPREPCGCVLRYWIGRLHGAAKTIRHEWLLSLVNLSAMRAAVDDYRIAAALGLAMSAILIVGVVGPVTPRRRHKHLRAE
jgi:hypothetical protein